MAKLEKDGRMGDGLANLAKPQQNQKKKKLENQFNRTYSL